MKILFAAAEAYPFVKSGGLGDVVGTLPRALQDLSLETALILPKHAGMDPAFEKTLNRLAEFTVHLSWRKTRCVIWGMDYQGLSCYFLENDLYFQRDQLYGYEDDGERYAFFAKAVLESLTRLPFKPDLIHCHDWHSALIPLLMKTLFGHDPFYFGMKTLLTIHNLKHQGFVPHWYYEDVLGLKGHLQAWGQLECRGSLNYLKAGILAADHLSTVSPTYAMEIQTPYYGETLDPYLRMRREHLTGILNGIDREKYSPGDDGRLFAPFDGDLKKKHKNKTYLQKKLGLPVSANRPLLGMVTRLVEQKGLDLVLHVLEEMLALDVQLVLLGSGERRYEEAFEAMARRHPTQLSVNLGFSEDLAHQIYAAADLFLMPSKFEPCGLSQMIAMTYMALPVVRETGGLKDSVTAYNQFTGEGTGFSFANYNAHELLFTVKEAVALYREKPEVWQQLARQAGKQDFSWIHSAVAYKALYQKIRE